MAFKKRSSGGRKVGLSSIQKKRMLKRIRRNKIGCVENLREVEVQRDEFMETEDPGEVEGPQIADTTRLNAAEGLVLLQEPKNWVWANCKSPPFIVTPSKQRGTRKIGEVSATCRHEAAPSPGDRSLMKEPQSLAWASNSSSPTIVSPLAPARTNGVGTATPQPRSTSLLHVRSLAKEFDDLDSDGNNTCGNGITLEDGGRLDIGGRTCNKCVGIQVNLPMSCSEVCNNIGSWHYEALKTLTPREFRRLTGLNAANFEVLYSFLGGDEVCNNLKYNYRPTTPKRIRSKLTSKDKLLLTLVRLRRGFAVEDCALLFGVSKTVASDIFYVWVQFLYLQFKRIKKNMCVTRFDQLTWKIAPCFRPFKNIRIVVDSTEVRIQTPYNYRQQGNTYSTYKAGNVINYLVGISAWGSISYISQGFEGAMSDRKMIQESDLMDFLDRGDLILVDRGFSVQDIMDNIGVTVLHPPFLGRRKKFTPEETVLNARIASSRSHVERAIRKIKAFCLVKKVTNKMLPIVDQMFYVCACLSNFDGNIVTA